MLALVLATDEKPLKNQSFCGSIAVFESPLGHHAAADIVSAAALFALFGGYPGREIQNFSCTVKATDTAGGCLFNKTGAAHPKGYAAPVLLIDSYAKPYRTMCSNRRASPMFPARIACAICR